jgi:hypothetical protein
LRLIKLRPACHQQEDIDLELLHVTIDGFTSRESSEDIMRERSKTLKGSHGIDTEFVIKKTLVDEDCAENSCSSDGDSDDDTIGSGGGGSVHSLDRLEINFPGKQRPKTVTWL